MRKGPLCRLKKGLALDGPMRNVVGVLGQPFDLADDGFGRFRVLASQFV